MATKPKASKKDYKSVVNQLFHGDLTAELRQLIDLAVRKEFNAQEVVDRIVNTQYFRQKYPGLIEKNGTIANFLTGQEGAGVSFDNLRSAIKNYGTALNQFTQIAQQYGYHHFSKDLFAESIKQQTSAKEFQTRLAAIADVKSNPAVYDALLQQAKLAGIKPSEHAIYQAAAGVGDRRFLDIVEATKYQAQLGLGAQESKQLAKGITSGAGGSLQTPQSIDQVIGYVRQNLAQVGPELASQGINPAQLVKVLSNPSAFAAEMDKISQIVATRKSLYGRPVIGSYAQRGPGGGLSVYDQQQQQAYG